MSLGHEQWTLDGPPTTTVVAGGPLLTSRKLLNIYHFKTDIGAI